MGLKRFEWRYCRIVLAVGVAALFAACNPKPDGVSVEAHQFEQMDQMGMVNKSGYIFQYNEATSQYAENSNRSSVRMQYDDQSAYVHAVFLEEFGSTTAIGEEIDTRINYKLKEGTQELEVLLPMTLLKIRDKMLWLWNEKSKIGLIIAVK